MGDREWEQQEEINRSLLMNLSEPVVISFCDYILFCASCEAWLAVWEHQIISGADEDTYSVQCPVCGAWMIFFFDDWVLAKKKVKQKSKIKNG